VVAGKISMVKNKLFELLKRVVPKTEIDIEMPKEKQFGDYSTNLALDLARKTKKNPLEIAQKIVKKLPKTDFIEKIEVAPPGFINFYLKDEWLAERVGEILKQGERFGSSDLGKGQKIQIEFISANPTGPLTLGNGRGGFLGDVLANVLEKTGYQVEREYYLNDTGNQILALGQSILNSKLKTKKSKPQLKTQNLLRSNKVPERSEGFLYRGEYIKKIAQKIKETEPKKVGEQAAKIIFEDIIKKDIQKMGIKFDAYKSEKSLINSSAVKKAIEKLKKKGLVYQKDDAVWFSSTKFGDDQDRVLIKKTGEYTYFASDIAYHLDKINRGFDLLLDIWGADHHGDVPRIKAIAKVFGFEDKLKIILHQFVRLLENGKTIRMSKRTGTYITLSELIDEVGLDVVRFFFLTKSPETHLDFDLKLAKEQSEKNPVYYIQYATARCSSILRKSQIPNPKSETNSKSQIPNLKLLIHPAEIELIKQLIKFPDILEEISQNYQVQKLPFYALDLATSFHNFYEKCRVISAQRDLSLARLSLVLATQIVLKNTLNILGIRAPETM
jgi:arginyl-tRNA synthetase